MEKVKVDLATARALVAKGWACVPTNSDEEKRPLSSFHTAGSWRDFSERLPTDDELSLWFTTPRRAGVVLHKGQLVVDFDTKDSTPDATLAPVEETAHGWHQFWSCAPETQISHDRDAKIDYLTFGSFVRLCNPACLLDWDGVPPVWDGQGRDKRVPPDGRDKRVPPDSLLGVLQSQGWRLGSRQSNGWFSLVNGSKTAAISADGSVLKMFSATLLEPPQESEKPPPPILDFAALKAAWPEMPKPLVHGLLRHGETALLFGRPKVQKSFRCLHLAHEVATGGVWAGFRCDKGPVLYIDNETNPALLAHRFTAIAAKHPAASESAGVDFLPVWDKPYTLEDLAADAHHFKQRGYALIVFDILARGLPDWCESESDNRQCAKVWNCVQKAAAISGAAILVVHHARKSTTDDIVSDPSGAGWTRYASTIISLRRKTAEDEIWLEAVCRSFPSPAARRM